MKSAGPTGFSRRGFGVGVILFLLTCLVTPSLYGQVLYGSVVGVVRDATAAVLPGATVTATNTATGARYGTPASLCRCPTDRSAGNGALRRRAWWAT